MAELRVCGLRILDETVTLSAQARAMLRGIKKSSG
jgi:hypothetical protein